MRVRVRVREMDRMLSRVIGKWDTLLSTDDRYVFETEIAAGCVPSCRQAHIPPLPLAFQVYGCQHHVMSVCIDHAFTPPCVSSVRFFLQPDGHPDLEKVKQRHDVNVDEMASDR